MKNTNKKFKSMAMSMAVLMLAFCIIGGTIAYLTAVTNEITNVFTFGAVNIELTETSGQSYNLIPGKVHTKNPTLTVEANSVECWLFAKVVETANFDNYVDYDIADGWTELAGEEGVYYRKVAVSDQDQSFGILLNDQVKILDTVTNNNEEVKLSFKGYACQSEGFDDVTKAWEQVENL